MIFGRCDITRDVVETHNDSYMLASITTVSARRPFLGASVMMSLCLMGFSLSFGDLLYPHEIALSAAVASFLLGVGFWLGELKLLSRDLKGSDLSTAIWGSYSHINRIRRTVAKAARSAEKERQSTRSTNAKEVSS